MAINNDVIDSVKVEPYRCKEMGYLEAMQRCLKMKHQDAIAATEGSVSFYLQVASSMNTASKKEK